MKQVPRSGPGTRPPSEPASPFPNVSELAPGVTLLMVLEVGSCPSGPEVTSTRSWRFGDLEMGQICCLIPKPLFLINQGHTTFLIHSFIQF